MSDIDDVYRATAGLPAFMKNQARAQAHARNAQAAGEAAFNMADTTRIGRVWQPTGETERVAAEQSAAQEAAATRWAGMGEAFWDAVEHNVTGRIVDMFRRGDVDPDFKIGDAQFQQMGQAGILANTELADYVAAANNQEDFERRLGIAVERKDYFERAANTQGIASLGNTAMGFIGGMADPVAVLASLGAGAAVAGVRSAAAVGRLRTVARPAAAGATENIIAEEFIRRADNQDFDASALVAQGLFGSGLGALGGLLAVRAQRRADAAMEALGAAASRHLEETLQSRLDATHEAPYIFGRADPLSTDIADLPTHRILPEPVADGVPFARTPVSQAVADIMGNPRESIFAAQVAPQQTGGNQAGAGRVPVVSRTSGNGSVSPGFAPIQHARYQAFQKQGLIEEVHARELEGLPADAKAVYVPEDGKVYIVRDRLTPEEVADPTGLIAHEIGVHYGLERMLGSSKYTQVLGEVNRLARTDKRMREAMEAVPADTPANLVLEEALGYFAEKNTTLGAVSRILADLRAWLREHIPLFKHLHMTANEMIRLVQGSVEAARNPAIRALEAGAPRFSRSGQATPDTDPVRLRMGKAEQTIADKAYQWDETVDAAGQPQQDRLKAYYDARDAYVKDGTRPWLDSPGLITARSQSKVARYLGAHLFESATGLGKRESTVALDYEMMQQAYKWQAIPKLKEALVQGLTARERGWHMVGGAKQAEDRIWLAVAEERERHRAAVQAGATYESTAPAHIQAAAKALDDFYERVTRDGLLTGNPMAGKVRGAGVIGHMPYTWRWDKIARMYRENRTQFNAFYDNLTQQYAEKLVDPALAKLAEKGPVLPEEAAALRKRMMEKVAHVVDNKLQTIMRDPQSRIDSLESRFELIAGDLLDEQFAGARVTPETIAAFKEQLGDIRRDRSRTEMDLLREVNGVRLLDFLETNALSQVTHGAHRWAGLNALARKGFTDLADAEAAIHAARLDGATQAELDALDYGFRAFGLGQLTNAERAAFNSLRNFTFAAMMGKLGLSVLADIANVAAATGIRGMIATIGHTFAGQTELAKQFALDAPGLLGQDYRLHSLTPDASATGRIMVGEGSTLNRVSQRAAQATSYISGANFAQKMLHRGFLPVFTEGVLRAIKGQEGGMTRARLVDLGLDTPTMARIQAQLAKHDAGRKRGGRINWDKWDDQEAADQFIQALHRGTYQTFQRAMVGEQSMWITDTVIGSIFAQFRRYGFISAEKQVARNVAIGDVNTGTAFVVGTAWAAMLYVARLEMNTAGMSDEDKRAYIERNTQGFRLASGILNLMNMSGILPEGLQVGEVLFGGTSYQQRGSPIAAAGYLGNITQAANQLGSYLTGQEGASGAKVSRGVLRILPGGNSVIGSWLANEIAADQ